MSETIEQICLKKGVKLTDQRKIIAKVLSESKEVYGESDHPDVDELYQRVSKLDHLIDIKSGEIIEFVDEEIEKLQKKVAEKYGYNLVDHKLELYGVKKNK